MRRFRGAARFHGPRPSSGLGAPFWPSGLTVRRSRPPTAAAELRALATMSKLSRFVSIASLCLLLVGCYETYPPIKSASITHWQGGKPQGAALQLTPENIAKLSAWLQNHRWGWHPVIATYAPATLLTLTHSDGTISSANLMQKTLIVGQNQRKLSASESQELHSIIGAQNGG